MSRWIRTFVAIEAPGAVGAAAQRLIGRLREIPAQVRWTEPPLHFTLKFLGDVDVLEIPNICDAVAEALDGIPPFDLEIRGAGGFPTPEHPRTLWIGTGEGTEEMVEVHAEVERKLAELGYRTDGRRYRPHLTIGRVRRSPDEIPLLGAALRAEGDFSAGGMRVDEVGIYSSQLTRNGPVYELLGHVELT